MQSDNQLSVTKQENANSDYAEHSAMKANFTGTVGTGASMGSANVLVSGKYDK